ncbi:cyclase dehydrase [Aureimonas sp. Leaf454]|uniref:hypothetical protein n=1 Tax=Aureimonas sp. Leaf454 TaxID=1736381 RepID=UPI0006FF13E5|nr:hypothetical protein [Aureimonas sp. Leaf454]KQT51013.1 cyclase dehydrase [Aureimonas sp. Leaf454]
MSHLRTDATESGLLPPRTARTLAEGLGWFSLGLGLVELLAARRMTRALGLRGSEGVVQAYGLREIATGLGILSARDPTPWLWGRVGGDALDMASLAPGLDERNAERRNVGIALAAVAGVALLDIAAARSLSAEREGRRAASRQAFLGRLRAYGRRSGLPKSPAEMRGAASDLAIPRDFKTPDLLKRWV